VVLFKFPKVSDQDALCYFWSRHVHHRIGYLIKKPTVDLSYYGKTQHLLRCCDKAVVTANGNNSTLTLDTLYTDIVNGHRPWKPTYLRHVTRHRICHVWDLTWHL